MSVVDAAKGRQAVFRLDEYHLQFAGYQAWITRRGAALRKLTYLARDLVVPFLVTDTQIPAYRGTICAPWPNRLADATYVVAGQTYSVPCNEPERNNALHGWTAELDWDFVSASDTRLVLTTLIDRADYPAPLELIATFTLDLDGLHTTIIATNRGKVPVPFGVCPHPYLLAGATPLDTWKLQVSAGAYMEVTPDRLLPVGVRTVEETAFDFRQLSVLGDVQIDHAFTDLQEMRLQVLGERGQGVGMSWDEASPWLQIHTADLPDPVATRLGLAVEPMTCPPDAFNHDEHRVEIEASQTHTSQWSIYAIDASDAGLGA